MTRLFRRLQAWFYIWRVNRLRRKMRARSLEDAARDCGCGHPRHFGMTGDW